MEHIQSELELKLLKQGYDKDLMLASDSFDRAEKGNGSVLDLPKGKILFLETFNNVKKFLDDMIEKELPKRRKSTFYASLIEKQVMMYTKDIEKATKYSLYEQRFDNPISLLSYFITRELTKLMVKEEIVLTFFCRRIANTYMQSFYSFGDASDSELVGVIQLVRTFVDTNYSKFFKTVRYTDGIVIKLKPEFSSLKISKEELLDEIREDNPSYKPMVVPPVQHKNLLDSDGGYLVLKSPLLKSPEWAEVRQYQFSSTNDGAKFFAVINKMQSTEWAINTEFLNWMKQCTHPEIQKYFNNDVKKLQLSLNAKKKSLNKEIAEERSKAKTSNYHATQALTTESRIELVTEALNANDRVDELTEELFSATSYVGKVRGWQQTLIDAETYSQYEKFYHPLFCDNRGRVYTYNTSLSFQGNSLAKVLVRSFSTERLNESGLYELQVLLGGMFEGYSKKAPTARYKRVQELQQAITECIEHNDYSIIDLIDEDELLQALNLMFALYMHNQDSEYKTGILAYIDATSSAIQIQAIVQRCFKAAGLTNLLPNSTDDLPDAYKAVAETCQAMCTEIAAQTDEDINTVLKSYYLKHDPEKLNYMGY